MRFLQNFYVRIKYRSRYPLPHTQATFKALVDAFIPRTPGLAEKLGHAQAFGALDLYTDEYQIWSLNHNLSLFFVITDFNIHLAGATAKMLDVAAGQLIHADGNRKPVNSEMLSKKCVFAALAPDDRFRAITLLEQLKVDLASLPVPFFNNPGFVLATVNAINLFAIVGYYSEWPGYGSTRMETPEKRKLEYFPIGWKQVGYPGPSKGYHALRGYAVEKFME